MKRKFWIALLIACLSVLFVFALTACGETEKPDGGNGGNGDNGGATIVTPGGDTGNGGGNQGGEQKNEKPASRGLKYQLIDGGYEVSGYTGADVSVVIPSTCNGEKVVSIAATAFKDNQDITGVTIPSSIKSIEAKAFYNCTKLKEVDIYDMTAWCNIDSGECFNNYLNSYYNGIFNSHYDLYLNDMIVDDLVLPATVKSVKSAVFAYCGSITSVTIPNWVESIGIYAFYRCKNFIKITALGDSTEIEYYAMQDCPIETAIIPAEICGSVSNAALKTVVINGGTRIGKNAFKDSEYLTTVTMSDSVTDIDDYAFYYCSSLTSVMLGNGVTNISNCAFSSDVFSSGQLECNVFDNAYYLGNENNPYMALIKAKNMDITSCNINEKTKIFADHAFYSCKKLVSIIIPDNVSNIGNWTFYECINLTSVTIGDGLLSIGEYSFYSCSNLTNITIPNNVTNIKKNAFYKCDSLTSMQMPDSLSEIGRDAFGKCKSLRDIYITDIANWCNIDYYYYYYGSPFEHSYNLYLNGELVTSLILPNGITKIANYAFYNCDSITHITISNSITSIGDYAFMDCYSLTSVMIGNSVTSIGIKAFYGCSSLTSVTIPSSVKSIGDSAFSCDNSLNSVYITDIGAWCNISFGDIDSNPLRNARNLYLKGKIVTSLILPNGITKIANYAFYNCGSITSIMISNSVTSIGEDAFSGCSSLTSIMIPNSVTNIGDSAFYGCSSLTSVTIPDSVTSIGEYAFRGCNSLTSITIPDSVTSIGDGAFAYCSSLKYNEYDNAYYLGNVDNPYVVLVKPKSTGITSCNINENTKCLYTSAFSGCSSLTSITIPDSVTSIGDGAFWDCSGLTSITIPDSVTSIGKYAFSGCSSLTSITIPDSVMIVKDYIFNSCTNLETIYCEAKSKPNEWSGKWNNCSATVVWGV